MTCFPAVTAHNYSGIWLSRVQYTWRYELHETIPLDFFTKLKLSVIVTSLIIHSEFLDTSSFFLLNFLLQYSTYPHLHGLFSKDHQATIVPVKAQITSHQNPNGVIFPTIRIRT